MIRAVLAGHLLVACSAPAHVAVDAVTDTTGDPRPDDPCPATTVCPMPGGLARGSGLTAVDRCAFPIVRDAVIPAGLIGAYPLPRVTLADIAGDLNRTAEVVPAAQVPGTAPGVRRAFRWQAGDESVPYWIPQGITGSFDGAAAGTVAGKKLVLVSWYYERTQEPGSTAEKGVRIAIADVTDPDAVRYRFALLVEPTGTSEAPSFTSIPIHAGGLAWIGDRLYVPVTGSGFRVFDLANILRVDATDDRIGRDAAGAYAAYGYQYAIPQIERIVDQSTCNPVFSFVAYDATSRSLVTGEYSATSIGGRLFRWPLAPSGELAVTNLDRTIPDAAYVMNESHVQGAIAHDGTWWLSSSRPAGGAGELLRVREATASVTLGWSDSPEDLAYDPQRDSVWSLTESLDQRYVFEVARTAIAP
jgi:hypothetical protein